MFLAKSRINAQLASPFLKFSTQSTRFNKASLESRPESSDMSHFKLSPKLHALNTEKKGEENSFYVHPFKAAVWTKQELMAVEKTHKKPNDLVDSLALNSVKLARWSFDTFSGFRFGELTQGKVINRAIFLGKIALMTLKT